MKKFLKYIIYIMPLLITLTTASLIAQDDHNDHETHGDILQLTQAEMEEFGIILSTAGAGTLRVEVIVPGDVTVNFDKQAHISPRFPGIVRKVIKNLGDKVKRGDVLAIIESNEGLTSYEIKSLLDGTVIEKHITIGEVLHNETPAFVIANLETVWVNLSIYQMHLPYVREGQQVEISSSAQGLSGPAGVISYLSPIVDEQTRTATARVVIPNHDGTMRPGLFVEGKITISEDSVAVLVPKSSLQHLDGNMVIFVSTSQGFVPVLVKTGRTDESSVEILSGLKSGQKYVSKGGFTLKAELEKSSLGDGHNH